MPIQGFQDTLYQNDVGNERFSFEFILNANQL